MAQPSANIFHDVAKIEQCFTILVLIVQLEALRHVRVKLNHIGKVKLKEIDIKGTVSHDFEPLDFKINS
jgi:dethiobiotin synthetase